jgi:hypothetical protein
VATQVLNEFEIESSQPFMLRDILPGAAWAPYRAPTQPIANEMDYASEAAEEDGNCVRGFLVAICLECVIVAGVFGVWHVWHMIR